MMEVVNRILEFQSDVLYIIVGASITAAILKRELLGSDLIAILAVPVYIVASLLSLYVFRYNYWVVVSDRQIEAVIASTFGITVSFLLYLVLVDFVRAITGWHVKRIISQRNIGRREPDRD